MSSPSTRIYPRTDFLWTKGAKEFPLIGECLRPGCYARAAFRDEERANIMLALHKCPYMSPAKVGLLVSQTLLEECWEMLDETVETLMEGNLDPDQKNRLQGEARGMAKLIQLFMRIYFADVNAVSAEAKKRYDMKKAGEEYSSPGLGSRKTEFPPGFRKDQDQVTQKQQSRPQRNAARPAPKPSIGDQEKEAIKFASESGMFTKDQIAKTYKISVADVDAVLAGS